MPDQIVDRKLRILEVSERSGGASKIGAGTGEVTQPDSVSDPEVPARATRRRFSARYKLKILGQTDQCPSGELGALLRREGLYWSNLQTWRRQRQEGTLQALAPRKRGRKAKLVNPLTPEVKRLQRENRRLKRKLEQAEIMLDIQKKASEMMGISLRTSRDEDES